MVEDFSVLAGAAFSEVAAVDVLDFSATDVSLEVDADDSLDDDSDFVACLRASEGYSVTYQPPPFRMNGAGESRR